MAREPWNEQPLAEVAEVIMGTSPMGGAYNTEGIGLPLLNGPTEFGPVHPTPKQWTTEVTRTALPGDVLFCVRGSTTGRQNLADQTYCIGRGLAAVRGKGEHTVTSYLQFVLQRIAEDVLRVAKGAGSTFPSITSKDFRRRIIALPPLPEQKKIAAILGSVDDAIQTTQAVIDQTEHVKKGLLQELLTRGMPGRHSRFKKTEIGEIPESWELHPLSELAKVQTGLAKNRNNMGAICRPYLRVANVQDGYLALSEVKTVNVSERAIERHSVQPGDVLFTEGGDADKLGRGTVWRGEVPDCLHQNHVFAVRPNCERLVPEFLSYFGSSARGKAYFLDAAKQTTNLASINSTQLKNLPVPIPSLMEQQEIVEVLQLFEKSGASQAATLRATQRTKRGLMNDLLTGRMRVNV